MIREHLLKAWEQALGDLTHFRVNDFLIDTEPLEEGDETELTIRYRYNKDYWFIATIPYQQVEVQDSIRQISYMGYSIRVYMIPGEIKNRERSIVHNSEGLVGAVEAWTIRLEEELGVLATVDRKPPLSAHGLYFP